MERACVIFLNAAALVQSLFLLRRRRTRRRRRRSTASLPQRQQSVFLDQTLLVCGGSHHHQLKQAPQDDNQYHYYYVSTKKRKRRRPFLHSLLLFLFGCHTFVLDSRSSSFDHNNCDRRTTRPQQPSTATSVSGTTRVEPSLLGHVVWWLYDKSDRTVQRFFVFGTQSVFLSCQEQAQQEEQRLVQPQRRRRRHVDPFQSLHPV